MAGTRTQAPSRARKRSPFTVVVALLLVIALAGSALIGAWLAFGTAQERGLLGGPVVVPEELRPVIRKAAKRCEQVPLEIFAAQIAAESSWDPNAVSPAGARGIAQFMPAVWEQYGIDADGDGSADIWNPVDAIHSAAELNCINRRLVREASGNRLHNTLAAYNAGFGSVLKYDGIPPFPETEAYVARILKSAETIVLSEPTSA
jgi:soluble lytic murein transglycosylase-like protein